MQLPAGSPRASACSPALKKRAISQSTKQVVVQKYASHATDLRTQERRTCNFRSRQTWKSVWRLKEMIKDRPALTIAL